MPEQGWVCPADDTRSPLECENAGRCPFWKKPRVALSEAVRAAIEMELGEEDLEQTLCVLLEQHREKKR